MINSPYSSNRIGTILLLTIVIMKDAIIKSRLILTNKSRFSTNVIERAIVFLSLNDSNFNMSMV